MSSLKIEISQNITQVLEILAPPAVLTFGRGKENDVVLLDHIVSRNHARFYQDQKHILVEDLDSANGVYVNGNRIFLKALENEDIVKIGGTTIYFSSEILGEAPIVVDLIKKPLSEYDTTKILTAPDILFRFFSKEDDMEEIYKIAAHKFSSLPLEENDRNNLEAGLNEAIGNAQRHGHKFAENLIIEFRYIYKKNRLVLRVTDQGEGFDYRSELRRKSQMSAIEAARERHKKGEYGGLGIMMMLKCVDQVDYNRKGNQITLTKSM